jgi:hypothetical protein
MTMVSTRVDGLGDSDAPDDGLVDGPVDGVGDGLIDGAGVSSGGPESIDGAGVGGMVGTVPRLPDVEHAALASTRPTKARTGRTDR